MSPETAGGEHSAGPSSGLARRVLELLSRGDAQGFASLTHPEIEIHTARGVRRGAEQAAAWAEPTYDHLERRYEVDELHVAGERVLVLGRVEYAWREGGEVGDSSPIAIALEFEHGRLRRWRVHDDPDVALKVFRSDVE